MSDDRLVEIYTVKEIFVDGFTKHTARDGVMSCVGFRNVDGRRVVVVRLAWPEINTEAAIDDALNAMTTTPLSSTPKPSKRRVH